VHELERIDALQAEPGRSLAIVRPLLRAHAVHRHLHAEEPDAACGWCADEDRSRAPIVLADAELLTDDDDVENPHDA
jgi:hypothetical protein